VEAIANNAQLPPTRSAKFGRKHRPPKRTTKIQLLTRDSLDGRSNAAKYFDHLVSSIENDLSSRDALSTIEHALIEAFAGACVTLQNLNTRLALGEEIDLSHHAQAISAMVKVASRLGLRKRLRDVTPDPLTYSREAAE
jgi:hypothetical protein